MIADTLAPSADAAAATEASSSEHDAAEVSSSEHDAAAADASSSEQAAAATDEQAAAAPEASSSEHDVAAAEAPSTEQDAAAQQAPVGRSGSLLEPESDPHDLRRFVQRQQSDHVQAVRELRDGRKASCNSWWTYPTPPFMKNGRDVGTGMNRTYALKTDQEGLAYLRFRGGWLRKNYLEVMSAVVGSLDAGTTPVALLGIDVPRCEASARYFLKLARASSDAELGALCSQVLAGLAKGAANKRARF